MKNIKTYFLSETIRHRVLIFGIKHHLVDLYHVCSNYAPGAKMARLGCHMFYIVFYIGKTLSETIIPRALIFGM